MLEVSQCVICDGPVRILKSALVAPFLSERVWKRKPFRVHLVGCGNCGFMFYNPRMDRSEEERLYTAYRSAEYQQMRFASEPWYTESFNVDLASPASYDARKAALRAILKPHFAEGAIRRVLDFGGDRGDLVQGLIPGADAYVYDISGVEPAKGVTPTTHPADVAADLMVNSNVMEHVGFPRAILREMLEASPSGGYLFVEVPAETPFGFLRLAKRVAQVAVIAITRPTYATSMLDSASLYLMHEHVNYFDKSTLVQLMQSEGCRINASGSYVMSGRAGRGEVAWCLAQKP